MSSEISADQIEIIQEFVQESRDMIEQLEPTIIELGNSGGDEKTINAVFRLFHSMKGSAGFLEFNHITRVAHAAENLLDLVRSGTIELQTAHVSLLCETCDFAKEALEHVENSYEDEAMAEAAEVMGSRLEEAITLAKGGGRDVSAEQAPSEAGQPAENAEFDLQMVLTAEMIERFVQEADELLQNAEQGLLAWEENPEDRDVLADLFRHVHSFKGNCGFFGYGDMEKLSHQMETVLDEAKSGSNLSEGGTAAVLLELVDVLRDAIANVAQEGSGRIDGLEEHLDRLKKLLSPRLGEMLIERGLVDSETVEAAVNSQRKPLGEILVDMGKVRPEQVAAIVEEQQKKKTPQATEEGREKKGAVKRQDIRVDLEKLDNLINLIGEMVIAENMLIHNPDLQGLELENFNKAAQQMSKLVRELQEMAMVIRMIPVSGLFRRMIRLVHDLSVKSGKKVELKLFGEETEVDKTVIETITDPLVHLLRNSLDHGLEPPEERRAAGKVEKGTVKLSARHEEGEVWITIEDDGRGLNREKILAKAIKNGLIEGDGSDLSDKVVYNMIFQPGFSTAEKITDISGRGVGMDVVKQNLEKIKGKVEVYSKPGVGTRMTLRIPLTLAIIDGMLVRVGETRCIVPILSIKEAFRPHSSAITITPDGEELARVRENFFPVIRLHEVLGKKPDHFELDQGILIVLEYQDNRICVFVDEILGQQQTVIKGLSDYIGHVRGFSGCTILGNGEVSLIMDVGTLMEISEEKKSDHS
ncbi:chemotaxis protein CheA [Desulfuromonas sp. AOP6]|uniref:chemotaxis protein CheA n=1 Tax=Desulfuromonas sp. AOP6 TaxID=1566351 RepID=UPI00127B0EBD|nr:chemotaxis protein CheA [Desulfuromonas sp. AOP6]BCA79101.1 hypothetical protein AOP6_0888 [Desulfuromonas sp. AOP6]